MPDINAFHTNTQEKYYVLPWAKDFSEKLLAFHEAPQRSEWIVGDGYKIYIRKSKRRYGYMFDIAAVEIADSGKGTFKNMLMFIEPFAIGFGFDGLFVENVMADKFKEFFRRNGWKQERWPHTPPDAPSSFFKMFYGEVV